MNAPPFLNLLQPMPYFAPVRTVLEKSHLRPGYQRDAPKDHMRDAMVNKPLSRMSREELPTMIEYVPGCTFHEWLSVSQAAKLSLSRFIVTTLPSPGFNRTF